MSKNDAIYDLRIFDLESDTNVKAEWRITDSNR